MVVAAVETAVVANIDRIGIVAAGSNNCVVAAIAAETVVCTVVVAVVVASVVAKIAAVVYWPVAVADAAGVVGATGIFAISSSVDLVGVTKLFAI